MKNFGSIKLLTITICFKLIKCSEFDLHKIIKPKDYQQVTLLACNNFSKTFNFRVISFNEYPSKFYDFEENPLQIYDNYYYESEDSKSTYYLQESLVIFFTTNLTEVGSFFYFLAPQLSVRQKPKCLIIFSPIEFDYIHEVQITYILNFAWLNKFLDFTIAATNLTEMRFFMIYYYNPFNDCVFKIQSPDEIFPDKLHNVYEYPLYITNVDFLYLAKLVRGPNKKFQFHFNPYFVINSAAEILNFNVVRKNLPLETIVYYDYLEKYSLDFFPQKLIFGMDYNQQFLIPTDDSYEYFIAFVPIIPISETNVFLETFIHEIIVFAMVTGFLLSLSYLKVTTGLIRAFDLVRIILGQDVATVPEKTVPRIIFLTIIIATVKMMNDFLLDTLITQFEEKNMPFESYEDLYNSQLKVQTTLQQANQIGFLQQIEDSYLVKVLNESKIISYYDLGQCFDNLVTWKNASCIFIPVSSEYTLSYYRNLFGPKVIKVAEPPISPHETGYFWFAGGSPYALKFLKVIRRIKETSLMHFPALFDKSSPALTIEETSVTSMSDGIELTHFLTILSFGYFISTIAVIFEIITFWIQKKKSFKLVSNV